MDCSEIGPSLPTYREAEPSTEIFHADVGGLSTQVAPTLSMRQPQNAPQWQLALPLVNANHEQGVQSKKLPSSLMLLLPTTLSFYST